MLKVYEKFEIPKTYKEAIRNEKVSLSNVKYIVVGENDNIMETLNFVKKISEHFGMLTLDDKEFFIVFND